MPGEQLACFEDGEGVELVAEVAGREGSLVDHVRRDDGPEEQQAQAAQEQDGQQISEPRAAGGLSHVLTSVGVLYDDWHLRSYNLPQMARGHKEEAAFVRHVAEEYARGFERMYTGQGQCKRDWK